LAMASTPVSAEQPAAKAFISKSTLTASRPFRGSNGWGQGEHKMDRASACYRQHDGNRLWPIGD
jgi:hypothetical protein